MLVVQKTESMSLKGQLASFLNRVGLAWWVEVTTQSPKCVYYFGPFASPQEAEGELPGFIEDLEDEHAQEIQVVVRRCKPAELTIFEDTDFSATLRPQLSQQLP